MKSFLISDNRDSLIGIRIAGIEGVVPQNKEETVKILNEKLKDKDIGIILLSEKIFKAVERTVTEIKLRQSIPLIVVIPDRNGLSNKDFITKYIKESVGVKL